ncbi:DUF7552 domain-containing protein [Halorussus halobius]|uniref:DUF7552 domain-containing protein n=1 Tax=Halorussus halobius TaxID=1710537 RepID=UPI001091D948|nr:hypothetical protein [Halorussus halobius]
MADRLETLQRTLDDLTDPDGEYAVVCPLSGKRPVPVRGQSFPSPAAAEAAADLVVEYRSLLREVDPHLENVPVVARDEAAAPLDASEQRSARRDRADASAGASDRGEDPTVRLSGESDDEWLRVTGAPVVRIREDGEPLDDAVVGLALNETF